MRGLDRAMVLVVCVAACRREPERGIAFVEPDSGTVVTTVVLRSETDTTVAGWNGYLLHVMVPQDVTEADTRVTLQHAIDSIARADSSINFIRASAFRIDSVVPGAADAPVNPIMHAVWGPADSSVHGARQRRTVFRTSYTVVGRFPTTDSARGRGR